MLFTAGQTILFQGDSITDAQRGRTPVQELGQGYAMMAAARLEAAYPELALNFLNRGVSGNRAKDLRARWQADCLDLRPDWVSILIGINDTWRRFDRHDATPTEAYEADLRAVLEASRAAGQRLILCEPFVLPVPPDRAAWRTDLDPRIHAVRALAVEFGAVLVPFDGLFAAAACRRPAAFWAHDGVHPSLAGHALMAGAWLRAVGADRA